MRLLITIFLVTLAAACCTARPAEDDYAYEDDAAAEVAPPVPSTKAPRHGLNSRTARGPSPLIGSRGVKTTAAPVKPTKPAEPEVVNEPEEVDEELAAENEEVIPVTTEAPKKGLMRGVVRPFRSNQDLLAALKRKRQQEHNSGGVSTHPPATATTATPTEPKPNSKGASRSNSNNNSSSGRRTFSRPNKAAPAAESVEEADTPKKPAFPSSSSRRFTARGKPTVAPAPVSEDAEGDDVEDPAPRGAKSFRGGRRV